MSARIVNRMSSGLSELYQRLKGEEFRRIIRFGVVGGSGVFVNLGFATLGGEVLFVAVADGTRQSLAVLLGIIVSIGTNFVLNDVWTWGDRSKHGLGHWFQRLGLYYVFSSIAATVQFGVALLLMGWIFDWHYLIADFVGIGCAVLINYHVNNRWTFREKASH